MNDTRDTAALHGFQCPCPQDWPEDWPLDNGMYMHRCAACSAEFIGHKRRVSCKLCAASPTAPPPTQPEGHEALSDERIDAIFNDNHNPQESPWVNWRRFARAIESAVKGE
jgi:hypothetical protein